MDRPFHGEAERRAGRHPAALEDVERKHVAFGRVAIGLQGEAQAGGRRFGRGFARAEERDEGAASLCRDRKAPQVV
ncbi:MAG TPA: hypothetical protein VNZ59_03600, partial [Burkholderiales bacterium]|nr:hypothetical protein [Burkholderiales bacterium]